MSGIFSHSIRATAASSPQVARRSSRWEMIQAAGQLTESEARDFGARLTGKSAVDGQISERPKRRPKQVLRIFGKRPPRALDLGKHREWFGASPLCPPANFRNGMGCPIQPSGTFLVASRRCRAARIYVSRRLYAYYIFTQISC